MRQVILGKGKIVVSWQVHFLIMVVKRGLEAIADYGFNKEICYNYFLDKSF